MQKSDIQLLIRHFKGIVVCYENVYKQMEEKEDEEKRRKIKEYDIKSIK